MEQDYFTVLTLSKNPLTQSTIDNSDTPLQRSFSKRKRFPFEKKKIIDIYEFIYTR